MARKDRMEADTTDFKDRVLDQIPERCVVDRGRLCGRVTTALARAEHAYKWGESEEEIFDQIVAPAVQAIGERCLAGIDFDKDRRTICGLDLSSRGRLPFIGEK